MIIAVIKARAISTKVASNFFSLVASELSKNACLKQVLNREDDAKHPSFASRPKKHKEYFETRYVEGCHHTNKTFSFSDAVQFSVMM